MWKNNKKKIQKSRTINTIANTAVGFIDKFLTVFLSFISRTVFIKVLGSEYLGINGLFTNILSILSLAELGIENAIIYRLYKPISDNDEEKIAGLITYYKKLYFTIGIVVLTIGICLIPFLHFFVNIKQDIGNIYIYYIMFLANSVLSYFYIYKTAIVKADQKEYKLKIINSITTIVQFILQIIVLVTLQNFYLYLAIKIVTAFITNVLSSKKAEKDYPYINEKRYIDKSEKKEIWKNVKDMFLYQIGGVILNNTDNILISMIVGTAWVGIYSNYDMIFVAITGFTSMIFTATQASVGNLTTENNQKKNLEVFNVLTFLSFWVYGFCSICFAILFQDFISIWLGENYLLPLSVVLVCVLNYYIKGVLYPIWNFRFTIGLFKYTKYVMLIASLINIVLSVVLGIEYGLFGILIATAIARLVTTVWYEPYKLFKIFFKEKIFKYYIHQIVDFVVIIGTYLLMVGIISIIKVDNIYVGFIIKILLCMIVPNIIFFIYKCRTKEFKYVVSKKNQILHRNNEFNQ